MTHWFTRHKKVLAAIGGCAYAVFWMTVVFQISIPWAISLPFHGFAMLTLAVGAIAMQQEQIRARPSSGWSWIPAVAVALTVFLSFELFLISTILFGLTAIRLHHLSKRGAITLIAGAVLFIIGFLLHGPFWSENDPEPAMPLALVFTAGLAVMAAGWVMLATDHRVRHEAAG